MEAKRFSNFDTQNREEILLMVECIVVFNMDPRLRPLLGISNSRRSISVFAAVGYLACSRYLRSAEGSAASTRCTRYVRTSYLRSIIIGIS